MIFDGDCGFCTTSAGWIERRLPADVRVAPWQILELAEYGLTETDVTTAAYWVDGDGDTSSVVAAAERWDAVAAAVERLGGATSEWLGRLE